MLQDYMRMVMRTAPREEAIARNSLSTLPTDILRLVMSFVTSSSKETLALVCTAFRKLVNIDVMRQFFDLASLLERKDIPKVSLFFPTSTEESLKTIRQRFWINHLKKGTYKNAVNLSFSTCDLSTPLLKEVYPCCERAVTLDLSLTSVEDSFFDQTQLCNLQTLSLAHCPNMAFTDIPNKVTRLTRLTVSFCPQVTSRFISNILLSCHSLQYFDLMGCDLSDEVSFSGERFLSDLSSLNVSQTQISESSLRCLAECCPKLHCLRLNRCSRLSSSRVVGDFHQLEELYFTHAFSSEVFHALCSSMTITKVDAAFSGITGPIVQSLLALPQLTWLNVSNCLSVRKESLRRDSGILKSLLNYRSKVSNETIKYFQINSR